MKKHLIVIILVILLVMLPIISIAAFNPEHCVAYMTGKYECGCDLNGTGAMIGRYGFVTAANVFYCPTHGDSVKYCNFLFGAKGQNSAYYRYTGGFSYCTYADFSRGYRYGDSNDIAYVIFKSPVGDEVGHFGWMTGNDSIVGGRNYNIYAYDATGHLKTHNSYGLLYNDNELVWEGWPVNGTKGGPVFIKYDGNYYVVGVYTYHESLENCFGRRITSAITRDMKNDGAFE